MLLGYVEYFGVQRVVVCLSVAYDGPPIDYVYGLNPMTGQTIPLSVNLPFSYGDIQAIYEYQRIPDGAIQKVYAQVIPTGLEWQFEREKERVIADAVQYAFANCGAAEGEILTEQQVKKLAGLMTQRMQPFILHRIIRRPVPNPFPRSDEAAK